MKNSWTNMTARQRALFWLAATALTALMAAGVLRPASAEKANAPAEARADTVSMTGMVSGGNSDSAVDVQYENTRYGFRFSMPADWKGFTVLTDQWVGDNAGQTIAVGPLLSLRSPLWTEKVPRQDIPVMVFTTAQWDALQRDVFHIGAAPVQPTELGRNAAYVFALPARYNYAFPAGYEEVERILANHPLETFEPGGGAGK